MTHPGKYRVGGLLITVALVLAACGTQQPVGSEATAPAKKVTLVDFGFSGDTQALFREHLAVPFEKAHPGVTVKLLGGISEDAIAQIKAAKGVSPYDTMLLGQPRYLQAQNEGWIQPLSVADIPNIANVYPNLQQKCSPGAVAWTVETIGVVYNPDLVPAPEKWADLWKPEYKGKIGMAAPSSNAGFLFLVLMNKLFGKTETDWDAAFKKLEELKPFVTAANPEALGQLLERKEIGVAITWSSDAAITIKKGFKVKFTYPAPGAVAQVGCYAVLKDTAYPDLAKAYVNQALGVEFQTAMSQAPFYFAPANKNVKLSPEALNFVPGPEKYDSLITVTDLKAVLAERASVTDRFIKQFGK